MEWDYFGRKGRDGQKKKIDFGCNIFFGWLTVELMF